MESISVVFEIPQALQNKLISGEYERIGGIIRDATSKQIIAWLRDGDKNLVERVLSTSIPHIFQQNLHMNMLSIALSGLWLKQVNIQLQNITTEIQSIKHEFKRNRYIQFQTALHDAKDTLSSNDITFTQHAARLAISGLQEAKLHLIEDFNDEIESKNANLEQAQKLLFNAMYASGIRARCYLATEQHDMAIGHLIDDIHMFEKKAFQLIDIWLGDYPAIFFHTTISDDVLERFIRLHFIRHNQEYTFQNLLDFIHEQRKHFWSGKAARLVTTNPIERGLRNRIEFDPYYAIEQCEIIFENLSRIKGFELEIRSIDLVGNFQEWDTLTKRNNEYQSALIIDKTLYNSLL